MGEHDHCPQNQDFVKAVTDLATTVEIQANNVKWIEKGARAVGALCIAVVCLVVVGIFYAGALHEQVQNNTDEIRDIKERLHVPNEVRVTPAHSIQVREV